MHKRLSLLLLPLLLLGACANPIIDDSASLEGYFKSTGYGDGFEVTATTFTYYSEPENNGTRVVGDYGYSGTIENSPDLTEPSGILILKITSSGKWGPTVGKYYAVSWKNLSKKGVSEAGAYKNGSSYNSGIDTLAQAIGEYTVAGGYFGIYAEYLRQ